ncbi:MAG TPA: cytochrome c maturation protein CcmE [Rhodospirillales bacterium]|jgi:cytochrome c-type biogenesis protein CcmE|nr:cytochrome c maturation protein CcmE [Rhodospirillales bacterium]HIL75616.1 cytochrome c maturation protein CcmE [Rhodospirillales bacterium]
MKRKHKRLLFVALGILILAAAASLILFAFKGNIIFFLSPTEITEKSKKNEISPQQRLRIGGLVEKGSLTKGVINRFKVTDLNKSIIVEFKGLLPDLFREGQGIVAEGRYNNAVFTASEVLAKHDETYMPPEVAEALKKSGKWKPTLEK